MYIIIFLIIGGNMTIRIFLVRHGLTIWNHEFRYQGHTDIELSSEGIEQAQALQKRLEDVEFTAIISSDLQRALQTATIINEAHQIKIQINESFKEVNFGVWEGLTYQDLQAKYPDQLKTWLETPHLLQVEKGETFVELRDRALIGFNQVISQYPVGNILIVSHGGTIAAMICGILQEPLEKMWGYKQKNASINILSINENRVTIELLNDTSHLVNKG